MNTIKYKFDETILRDAVKTSLTLADVIRKCGYDICIQNGSGYSSVKNAIRKHKIDTKHFLGRKAKSGIKVGFRRDIKEYLVLNCKFKSTSHWIKNRLFDEGIKKKQCEECNGVEWMGQPMPLSLHHINGNKRDNRLENLEILCSNCHSLTDNYCTKNWK